MASNSHSKLKHPGSVGSLGDEDLEEVAVLEDEDSLFTKRECDESVKVRFYGKAGCGEDFIFVAMSGATPKPCCQSDSDDDTDEDVAATNATKSLPGALPTGKGEVNCREHSKYLVVDGDDGKKVLRLEMWPQRPLIGKLTRKTSFLPSFSCSHLRQLQCAAVVYSIDDMESFNTADDMVGQIRDLKGDMVILLIANKSEGLLAERVISAETGAECGEKNSCVFVEVDPQDKASSRDACSVLGKAVYRKLVERDNALLELEGVPTPRNKKGTPRNRRKKNFSQRDRNGSGGSTTDEEGNGEAGSDQQNVQTFGVEGSGGGCCIAQ